jgi:predicted phage terminase large subunit-like protein
MPVWDILRLPAIADTDERIPVGLDQFHERHAGDVLHPERESLGTLEALKRQLGANDFAAQYLLRPAPPGGALVQWEWFTFYDELRTNDGIVIQSWDTATKTGPTHDYSVCTTWLYLDGYSYLMHVLREKLEFPALNALVLEHGHKWGAHEVIIEDAGTGSALIQQHHRCNIFRVWANGHQGIDKLTRMEMETPAIEAGKVLLKAEADWLDMFKAEITQFPYAKHDDIVDSVSQYLKRVRVRGFPRSRVTLVGPSDPLSGLGGRGAGWTGGFHI